MRIARWISTMCVCAAIGCSGQNHPGDACSGDCSFDAHGDGRVDGAIDGAPVDSDLHGADILSVTIVPANPTIVSMDGAMVTQQFMATGMRRDGMTMPGLVGTWSLTSPDLGNIDPAGGLFTANGVAAGTVGVHVVVASASGMVSADTMLTVVITRSVIGPGVPADVADDFVTLTTDATREVALDYPLDGAVMPQNVYPPDVQWEGGTVGDIYRITLETTHAQVMGYVLNSGGGFTYDWVVDHDAWRTMAESDTASPMSVTVDRFDSVHGDAVRGTSLHITIANGNVFGTVYYWWIDQGTIYQIPSDGSLSTALVPNPPPPPVNNDGSSQEPTPCIGCHSVSPNGRWLAGRLGGSSSVYDNCNGGGIFDLTDTTALTADPAQYIPWPSGMVQRWYWSAWGPDSQQLMINAAYMDAGGNYDYELRILHFDTMGNLTSADPSGDTAHLPRNDVAMPAWSPDGNKVAFAHYAQVTGAERPSQFATSSLQMVTSTGGGMFGDPVTLHDNMGTTGEVDAMPSFSPDSNWIVYGHGSYGRSTVPSGAIAPDQLTIISTAGGTPVTLANANGSETEADSWYPSFSPFDTGGYFWLVSFSTRDYGNAQAGTRGTGRRQLWVTAINHHPDGTNDPSHVSYWLPGQHVSGQNITAFWAAAACRADGATCDVSSECCSGTCLMDSTGAFTCQAPPMSMCRQSGQTCSTSADCCPGMGLVCFDNVCGLPPG